MTDINELIKNAIGEKPADVQTNFNDIMIDKVRDVIAGKRDDVAATLLQGQEDQEEDLAVEEDEDQMEFDFTDEELEAAIDDDEDFDIEEPEEEIDGEESEDYS